MLRGSSWLVPLLVVALAGCAGASPSASPSASAPSVSASTTLTPTPTPDEPAVTAIVVDGAGMTLSGAEGTTLGYLDYFQPQEQAVATLTELLGFAPVRVDTPAVPNSDRVASTYFDFEGLHVLGPGVEGRTDWLFRVAVVVPAVRGIEISTIDGLQVGDDSAILDTEYGEYTRRFPEPATIWAGIPAGDAMVVLRGTEPDGTIVSILIPAG